MRPPFPRPWCRLWNLEVDTINGDQATLSSVSYKSILPSNLQKSKESNGEKEVVQRHGRSSPLSPSLLTYEIPVELCNAFHIKPHLLPEGLFIDTNLSCMNFFDSIAVEPEKGPKQMLRLWCSTGKPKPASLRKLAPGDCQIFGLGPKPSHKPTHPGLSGCATVRSVHDREPHCLKIMAVGQIKIVD